MEKAVDREKARRVAKINPQDTDKTFVCLIDLKLAFDKVDRNILIHEMIKIKLPIEVISIVAKILLNTSFDVKGGIQTKLGVQQGSVIAPTLFSIYINTLLEELEPHTISRHGFADDIAFVCYS